MKANGKRVFGRVVSAMIGTLAAAAMLTVGARPAMGQACAAQNWTNTTPNIWAAGGSIKVMLNNDATTNQPTIPYFADDGNFNPWGYSQHPQTMPELNSVWSCPSGTPVITVAGAGRETVSFQVFITAGSGSGSALTDVNVTVSPLTGPGTLTSDNTGSSNVTRYLEGYVPYTTEGPTYPANLQTSGQLPDPLIPFYDAYDSGNPAVATPFNVQAGTTQGVWVNISIPANQAAGAYTGTVTVSGNGIGSVSIPVNMTVWNGSLPAFDEGSINSSYADMLKSWLPFYEGSFITAEGLTCGGPGCSTGQALFQKYQVMGHAYNLDVQDDGYAGVGLSPTVNGCYPSGGCTSFTTDGTTSSIDWTTYDTYMGPSLTPGGLFSDGTYMRVIDSPLSTSGAGPWTREWNWYDYQDNGTTLPPAGLLQLVQNFATQISQHFAANHANKGWGLPELLSYTYDETYGASANQLGDHVPLVYQDISLYNEAINSSNSALSSTWAASTAPIHTFLTDEPACQENGDNTAYTNSACADHLNLSYPGGTNATPGYTNSWVTTWSSNPVIFMPGQPGPALHYGTNPTIIDGTGYQYTYDLTAGVPALSTAPVPIERWTYQGGDPSNVGDALGTTGVGQRINYWIDYKYGLDVTVPSVGDPNPAAPAPGGEWVWVGDFWGGTPSNCSATGGYSTISPYVNGGSGDGQLFYPGNQIGCYYTANPVGEAALTKSPAVNTSCTSNGYGTCNGISGPVASMRMEAMRRGYEDYEYLYLLGKQSGRSAALAIVNTLGGAGMTAGGLGTTSWQAMDWENVDGPWYEMGVEPESSAYSGNCVDSTPGIGGLANGLPNGPTGAASSGFQPNYQGCVGEWTNNPYRFAAARVQLAQALGWASATTPTITSLSPSSGANSGGTSVVITGTNFTGATEVQFGGVDATSFTVNSATQITAISPAGNGTVDVQVFGPNGSSQPSSGSQYTYVSPVTVTGLSPSSGVAAGGNSVTITGTDFAAGAVVNFGSITATNVVVSSATQITATAPAGTGSVYVTVTTSQGTSATNSSNLYTYEAPPTVTGVSPNSGTLTGGTSVTLSGTGFASGMTVAFGGNAATGVTVSSSTSATVVSPAGSSTSGGIVDVTVTTTNGTSPINGGDHYNYTSPVTITGVSPASGAPGGGTSVVITGTGFTGVTSVKFGGNTASFTVNSATQITATSPAGGGTVNISVTAGGYSNETTYADQYSYSSAVAGGSYAILPTTAVGSSSSTQNVSITLASATAISSITVPPTQNGVQEFTVGTVTGCSVGGTVNAANTVCTVPVTFKPQYPGVRTAALDVNNNGEVVGTAGLAGVGQGPQVAVTPGAITRAVGGGASGVTNVPQSVTTAALSVSNNGAGLAMDGAGNLYIADDINCLAYKVNAITNQIVVIAGDYLYTGTGATPSTTPEPALGAKTCPQAIAVDGVGNVYLIDSKVINTGGYPYEIEEVSAATGQIFVMAGGGTAAPSTTPQAATSVLLNGVNSVATDSAGNLYIADFFNNLVEKVTPAGQLSIFAGGGSTAPSTTPEAATSAALNGPTGMVMDDAGNFYISDQNISVIDKVNSSGQITAVAGGGSNAPSTTPQAASSVALNNPAGLAVDGAGDLYIADYSNQMVEQMNQAGQLVVVAGGGSTIPSATPGAATSAQLGLIEGVEVDGVGNLYIADGQNIGGGDNMVEKVSATSAALNFPFTNVGSSSVAQSVKVTNIGNQSVTFTSVSAATDFPLQSGGTCTMTGSGGQSLATSANCTLKYAFHPTVGGVLNESATLNDNNLNVSNATQPIAFTGTGVGGTNPQLTSINPPSGASGTSVTVTGTNLSGATEMTFGSTPVTPSSSTSTSVTATAPSGSGTVNVTVTTANGTSNAESFTYTTTAAATPTFSPAAGTYTSTQTVTISDSTSGATIYYTTNGSTPTTSSTVYSGPISVSATETLKAIATATGYTTSAVGSAAYTINLTAAATPTFSPAAGAYGPAQTVTISDATSGATIYYTTNGTTPTTSSTVYSSPITVSASETVEAIATASGYSTSAVGSAAYTINGAVATPTFSPAAGAYGPAQTVTISDATSGATIYYTTNGSTPTTSSAVYSSPITVSATETVKALAAKTGYSNSAVGSAAYTINGAVATPTFSPAAGTYTTAQTVTISDATSGATIYYTTNGTTPTTSSAVYSSPITVSATETVEALATKTGYSNSAVGSAAYTITVLSPAATPTFSPAAGTYTSAQTVTISDATSGATVYYTTNGTTPTTSSTVYSSPITVSTSETVEAIATASGYTQSAVGSAAYVINSGGSSTPSIALTPGIIGTLAGVQGGTTNPTSGMVASGNSIGAPVGIAVAPMINGAGGDIYFDNCSTAWNCSYNYNLYVIYKGGAAAKAILVADGISSPVVGDTYPVSSSNETGPASLAGITVDSYGNVLVADWSYSRVYMYYAGDISGQGTNPADAMLTANPSANVAAYGLHAGDTYHVADGGHVIGSAPTAPQPYAVYVDSAENVFFTDHASNGLVEVVYNTSGTSANTILTAEGYTGLQQGYTYTVAGGQSISTYPNDNDGGSSVAYNGGTSTANTAINAPWGISADSAGNLYFADSGSNKIKKLSGSTAVLSTIGGPAAGTATTVGHAGDGGLATAAQMSTPYGLVVDKGGSIYFSDTVNGSVRKIDPNGYISTVSGVSGSSGTYAGNAGNATAATLGQLDMMSVDANGNLYISDRGNDLIESVATNAAAAGTVVSTAVNNSGKFTYEGSFAFGNQAVNTSSAPATALISNITGSSVTLSSISIPSGYTQAMLGNTDVPDCTTTAAIAPGTSCTLALKFSPTAAGAYNGNATVTANGLSVTIAVTGTGTSIGTAATPTFSPAAGTYGSAQTVTISDGTSGATIYYTTNGTTPTTSSSVYSSPITVSTSETVEAIATAPSYIASAVGSAAYVIGSGSPAATPTFSPAAGTYTSAQTVTISDATSGATVYYTTNGTTPTTSSTVYSSPITVSTSETVKAIATASGYTTSAVGSAAYVINLPQSPNITTIAGVQGGTTNPTSGTVAYGNSIGGSRYGVAVAPVLNGAGGDVYFDGYQNGPYMIYKGGAAAKAILAASGISSPVVGDVYSMNLGLNETGPYMPTGLFVDSYGNLLIADRGYSRVYMLYAGTVTGQGTNPADALLTADPSAGVGPYYGLHAGYLYHVADGGSVVGSAPVTPTPKDVWVDSAENVFFTDGSGNGLVEVVYNTTGTSANTILTAEGYTSLKQGYTYIVAGGQSVTTYPNDNDGGSSVAYNGGTSTANTAINNPLGIYGDSSGNIYFADNTSNKIKKLSGSTAVLSTIGGPAAGTATTVGHAGDGGVATSAQMNSPIGVILDASGNIYFADSGNSSVRMIGTNGNISTVAGTSGTSGTYTGEGGPATSAVMNTTYFLSIDGSGNIYIVDDGNDLIHVF